MRALLACSLLAVGVPAAHADDTFESRAAGAQRVRHLDDIVWAVTAPCDGGTDTHQRQCRRLRDTRAAELANATLLVDAEPDAFTLGAWSAQKKSAPLGLSACIDCSGVELDGKTFYVVGTKEGNPAPKFEGGKVRVGQLLDNARPFPDEAAAKKFAASAKTAKIQLLVKLPAKPRWSDAGKHGIALDVLGYRVYSPCDGSVMLSSPKAGPAEVDRKACSAMQSVDELTPAVIKQSIKPVIDSAKACYAKFKVSGQGKLKLAIAADGSVTEYEQQGDFANTPTGACIDAAAKEAAFPRSKKPRTAVAVPISLP